MPAGSNVAMMTSTDMLTWVTPAPSTPGPILRNSARMRGVSRGRGRVMRIPARRTATNSKPSWNTPEMLTPQASACPTLGTNGTSHNMQAIDTKLYSTGAAAAAANRSNPFSTPDSSAVRQISGM